MNEARRELDALSRLANETINLAELASSVCRAMNYIYCFYAKEVTVEKRVIYG